MPHPRTRSVGSLEAGFFFAAVAYLGAALVLYLCVGLVEATGVSMSNDEAQARRVVEASLE